MPHPRCSVFIAASLDGYIARPDGRIDWLSVVEMAGEDYGFQAFFDSVDTLVVGRGTYDVVRGFPTWPYADKRCVVLSHREVVPLHGEERYEGSPDALVMRLAAEGARRVYVDGGATISAFLRAGLIDDMTVSVIPVLLGDGIPLFTRGLPERRLQLVASRSYPSGLVQVEYSLLAPT